MFVNFTDLNKACPKGAYLLQRIDQLVNVTPNHVLLSSTDAYSGYNHIKMTESNASHTTFYMDSDIYHYIVMPFDFINVGATYQRMIHKLFVVMRGVIMEKYVDDIMIKLIKGVDYTEDLRKTFEYMRLHQVRLNPSKCAFGVQSGKFLSYMVSHRKIRKFEEARRH